MEGRNEFIQKETGHTRWRHQTRLARLPKAIAALANGHHILIVPLGLQDAFPSESMIHVLIIEWDLQGGLREAGTRSLCLQLLLRGAGLVGEEVLLVVVSCQHCRKICWEWPPRWRFAMIPSAAIQYRRRLASLRLGSGTCRVVACCALSASESQGAHDVGTATAQLQVAPPLSRARVDQTSDSSRSKSKHRPPLRGAVGGPHFLHQTTAYSHPPISISKLPTTSCDISIFCSLSLPQIFFEPKSRTHIPHSTMDRIKEVSRYPSLTPV